MKRHVLAVLSLVILALGTAYVLRPEWFGQVEVCPCKNEGRVWIRRSDGGNFNVQVEAARQHQVPFIADDETRRKLIEQGMLVRLPNRGAGYRVSAREFTHSAPFYSQKTVGAFAAFALAFEEEMERQGIPDARLVVSSGSRTKAEQAYLAKNTSGAVRGESPHNYGAAIDIKAFEITPDLDGSCAVARKTLTKLLREDTRFHWVLERACLHLTAKPNAN
jgi:hypothetical protein